MRTFYTDEQLPQRSGEWKVWREGRITATQASVIMAEPPPGGPQTWRELRNDKDDERPINRAMKYGIENEPKALVELNKQLGMELTPHCVGFETKSGILLGASLDGYIEQDGEPPIWAEIKCPPGGRGSKLWADVESGKLPPYYLWQITHQYLCIGVRGAQCYFFVWEPVDGGIAIKLDSDMLHRKANELLPQIREYSKGVIQEGDMLDNEAFTRIEAEWFRAHEARKSAEAEEERLGKKLKAIVKAEGLKVARGNSAHIYQTSRTVTSWAAMRAAHPEIDWTPYDQNRKYYILRSFSSKKEKK